MKKHNPTAINNEIIIEESEASIVDKEVPDVKEESNLRIVNIIDSEVPQKDKTEKPKADPKFIREAQEENKRISLKEGKLRDTAISGLFMNGLVRKSATISQGHQIQAVKESKEDINETSQTLLNEKENTVKEIKKENTTAEDEWDKINEQRKLESESRAGQEDKTTTLTYEESWNQLKAQDLSKEMKTIVREDCRYLNFFQKIFAGCMMRFKLDKDLHEERDIILALMKAKPSNDFHSCLLARIFQAISAFAPPQYQRNYVLIGFQGSNPETDIRGTGLFGLLQVLYFAEKYPALTEKYLILSLDEVQKFPLVIVMFGFTALAAEALREGRITTMCNKEKSVIKIMNLFYAAAFCRMIDRWQRDKLTIINIDEAKKENSQYCKENSDQLVKKFVENLKQT